MKKILIIILFLLSLVIAYPVYATSINPAVIEISANPGEVVEEVVTLFNETGETIYLDGYIEIFVPRGEKGEVSILPPRENNLAVTWIKLPLNSISLSPEEGIDVPIVITVPQTAEVGGYYLAVMWESSRTPWSRENQVNTSLRVGSLILLRVNGDIKEDMEILEFGLNRDDGIPNFYTRIKNQGNIHLRPEGIILIKNFLGVNNALKFNRGERYILPSSIKNFNDIWADYMNVNEGNWWQNLKAEVKQFPWGKVSARLELEYGESKKRVSSEEVAFWVVPWRLIVILFIILVVVIFLKIVKRKNK